MPQTSLGITFFPLRQGNRLYHQNPRTARQRCLRRSPLAKPGCAYPHPDQWIALSKPYGESRRALAVGISCRAAVLLPFDMGRFPGDGGGIIMAHIEAADRALIVISAQHLRRKNAVTLFTDLQRNQTPSLQPVLPGILSGKCASEDLMGEGIDQLLISVE